nr:hypothetical protein [uncultured Eisenbergiella sp.]
MESKGKPELLSGNLAGFWSRRINVKIDWFIRLMKAAYMFYPADTIIVINN